jgi:hypothetical protein
MSGTVETLPLEVQRWVRRALVAAKVAGVLASALGASWVAVRSAADDARARAQIVKDKSEAGYQVTRAAMEDLEHRLAAAELAIHRLEVASPRPRGPGAPRRPIASPAPSSAPPPKPLPPDLDQAQRQVYRGTTVPATIRDGGT